MGKQIKKVIQKSSTTAGDWSVMGIVNMTPDSFYDGGRINSSLTKAYDYCMGLVAEGASILDIGGESTRPGSSAISTEEELSRVIPLVEKLSKSHDITLSVDTSKSVVAQASIAAGASMINDVSSGRFDPQMAGVIAKADVDIVLMHSRKNPSTMQNNPSYTDALQEVVRELQLSVETFLGAGVPKGNIVVDPGIGFAKTLQNNLTLLRHTDMLVDLGFPVLIGTSRKSFIGEILHNESIDRLWGSLATIGETYRQGASIFRVHDVAATVEYLSVLSAISGGHHE